MLLFGKFVSLFNQYIFFHYRKSSGGAILDPDDKIQDVLDDNDFVSIGNFPIFFPIQQA